MKHAPFVAIILCLLSSFASLASSQTLTGKTFWVTTALDISHSQKNENVLGFSGDVLDSEAFFFMRVFDTSEFFFKMDSGLHCTSFTEHDTVFGGVKYILDADSTMDIGLDTVVNGLYCIKDSIVKPNGWEPLAVLLQTVHLDTLERWYNSLGVSMYSNSQFYFINSTKDSISQYPPCSVGPIMQGYYTVFAKIAGATFLEPEETEASGISSTKSSKPLPPPEYYDIMGRYVGQHPTVSGAYYTHDGSHRNKIVLR